MGGGIPLRLGTPLGGQAMSSAIRTAAIVPRMVDAEAPSLDCCRRYPERISPFPLPGLPMAYFHNFPNVPPHRREVRSAME